MLEETSDDVSEMAKDFYKDFYWSEKIFCSLPIVKFKLFLPGRTHFYQSWPNEKKKTSHDLGTGVFGIDKCSVIMYLPESGHVVLIVHILGP